MARIRTIKPELFSSGSMARVSIEARYVLVGLLTEADDDGRFLASPKRLAGVLFPNDDCVDADRVEVWLKELEAVASIVLYDVNGVRYGFLPGFTAHQRIAPTKYRPSTLPEPVSAGQGHGSRMADTRQTHGSHVSANPRHEREVEVEVEREVESIAPRERDALFETVAEVCGIAWSELTKSSRGALNRAVADLRTVGATPDEVRRRAANWPYDVALTPPGLAKHWPALGRARTTSKQTTGAVLALAADLEGRGL